MTIKFHINWGKAIEAIVWLADRQPDIDHFRIAKVLYYADKSHLRQFGRPMLGDTYIAMEHGPVPSGVRDLLTLNTFLDPDILEAAAASFATKRDPSPKVCASRKPMLDAFSKSDLRCLEESFARYAGMSFGELRELTHRERAWAEAETDSAMDYALMIDADTPDREELIEQLRESAPYVVV